MQMQPDEWGRFGPFGGKFVPETLMEVLAELDTVYQECRQDMKFPSWNTIYRSIPDGRRPFIKPPGSVLNWAGLRLSETGRSESGGA